MSSRLLLRLVLLVQVLIACAIAAGAARAGAGPWQAAAIGLASIVLVRLAINANNFVMSRRVASPTPPQYQLGPVAAVRMLGEEFGASMLVSSWHMPRARPRTRIHPGSSTPPVLLLHGYGCNSGYWAYLTARLDAAGISHATLDLEPLTGDIDGFADAIEEGATRLLRAAGAQQVIVVGHSMGGLAAGGPGGRPGGAPAGRASSRLARRITAHAWRRSASASTRRRCGGRVSTGPPAHGCASLLRMKTLPHARASRRSTRTTTISWRPRRQGILKGRASSNWAALVTSRLAATGACWRLSWTRSGACQRPVRHPLFCTAQRESTPRPSVVQ
jgi:pimeloyl-ACP methyl ester carboxylesterase